jgi:hypothetical protein
MAQNPWTNAEYFPFAINLISAVRLPSQKRSHWACPEGSFVPTFSQQEIQKTINKKNDRIQSYRRLSPKHVWLLIIRGLGMSSTFDVAAEAGEHKYSFDFDRVFLFDWFSQTYFEIFSEA